MTNRVDTFNRADGAIGTPSDSGSAWNTYVGIWEVKSNQACDTSNFAGCATVLDASVADGATQVTIPVFSSGISITWRASDASNYWQFAANVGIGFRQFKQVSGSFSQVGSTNGGTPANNDVLKVDATGSSINSYVNGSLITECSFTDSFNNTATNYGISAFIDTTSRFDDFSFTGSGGGGGGSVGHRVIGGWGGRIIGE